ncbi:2-polyprenyl-6-methoxyphenol hydroxylase-like FAD-dependent oxidoreductase [Pseudoduganella flava]|uniref:FAD-dependent oxidoreductase n=1 Tax=Pseudoduganella flava TaxID=871742 RepID=A0A562PEU8_9BURK|nr:FAD-dependent monooxygenase [Pseudoduganella flava]QGZ42105.1 FAD-dependent oxidoreductase [Pseudoduganella flava]TWI42526.1 2-polyprenyl-6-methoxyphenol hydroxylase-like FAD-dependent oxidoreductase [Pseudoduganella flava]
MTHTHIPSTHDVAIAGAGPVGLFLACELALAGCTVLVLERAATPDSPFKQLPFGMRGLSSTSVEALDRRGLLDELEVPQRVADPHSRPPGPVARRQAGHFAGIPFHAEDIDAARWQRPPASTPTSLLAEMAELEAVLERRAGTLGVHIVRDTTVTGFDETAQGLVVHTTTGSIAAQWLVGCDGARSAVRRAAGIDFAGTEPEFTGCTALVDLAGAPLEPGRNVTERGMYFQSQPGYVMLQDFDGGAWHDSGEPVTRERLQQVLRKIAGIDVMVKHVHRATTWTDRARQAATYRKGRVLLVGDAAHIHSPLGGQGLNLGLGDALNLGWKLAATIRGAAPPGLLDTYHTERHPIGARVLDWSRAQVVLMRPAPAERALREIVASLVGTRDGSTYVAGRVWGIHTRIDVGCDHPLAGRSAPNFVSQNGATLATALRDGRGVLVDAGGDEALAAWAHAHRDQVHYMMSPNPPGVRAALVRPDGIVAWATDDAVDAAAFHAAAARWFV